jgi:nucleotide-binding universal stress UspA family protein
VIQVTVQMILQHPELTVDPRSTLRKILSEPGPGGADLLKEFSIADSWPNRFPNELSGGERQRVAVARALIVGLDGSENSRQAFAEAVNEASWRGAELLAVHVTRLPTALSYEYVGALDATKLKAGAERFVEAELNALSATDGGTFPVSVTGRVLLGHAGAELIRAAESDDLGGTELVVLGSRGRGGFKGLLLGSVTSYAVNHLRCRLLLIPSRHDT